MLTYRCLESEIVNINVFVCLCEWVCVCVYGCVPHTHLYTHSPAVKKHCPIGRCKVGIKLPAVTFCSKPSHNFSTSFHFCLFVPSNKKTKTLPNLWVTETFFIQSDRKMTYKIANHLPKILSHHLPPLPPPRKNTLGSAIGPFKRPSPWSEMSGLGFIFSLLFTTSFLLFFIFLYFSNSSSR